MKPDRADLDFVLHAMEEACRKLGVEVRYEDFSSDEIRPVSGRCRLLDNDLILIDRGLSAAERIRALREAMEGLNVEQIYLPPAVRESLESN